MTGTDQSFGVLDLHLGEHGYSFNYTSALAGPGFSASALTYSDAGAGTCHG